LVEIATAPTSDLMVSVSLALTATPVPLTVEPFSTFASISSMVPLIATLAPTALPSLPPAAPTAPATILPSSRPAFWVDWLVSATVPVAVTDALSMKASILRSIWFQLIPIP
jgi:hypothetical protein